jgi:hypothetical protein
MIGNAADLFAAHVTGESWVAKDTSQKRPGHIAIARLAYGLYEDRGREDGYDVHDWLRAEAILAQRR